MGRGYKNKGRETILKALLSEEDVYHLFMDQSFGGYDMDGFQAQFKRNRMRIVRLVLIWFQRIR